MPCASWKVVSEQPSNILVIQWARLGDLFHSRPLCEAALRIFHPASLTFSCDSAYANIVMSFPEVDRVMPLNLGALTAMSRTDALLPESLTSVREMIEDQHFDVVINLTNHEAAKVFASAMRASRQFGYGTDDDNLLRDFETQLLTGSRCLHIAEMWKSLVESSGSLRPPRSLMPNGLPGERQIAVLICDAGSVDRSLTHESIAHLCGVLLQAGVEQVKLIGSRIPAQRPPSDDRIVDLRGRTSLSELRTHLMESSCVIGPDTGALHYADALGKHVIGLYFAGARVGQTGPLCNRTRCIEAESQDESFRRNVERFIVDTLAGREDASHSSGLDSDERVSIVITEHAQTHYTDVLLKQLWTISDLLSTEIIVMSSGLSPAEEQFARLRKGIVSDISANPRTFAEACNKGAMLASGTWLLFLNDDCEISGDQLLKLVSERQNGTIVGPRLRHWDGLLQSSGFSFDGREVTEESHGNWVARNAALDGVSAAALLIERSLFMKLGGFDERFRNGYEDVDLCLRAQASGVSFKIADCDILHYGGSSPERFEHDDENLNVLLDRWSASIWKVGEIASSEQSQTPLVILSEESEVSTAAVLRWREPLSTIGLTEGIDLKWICTRTASSEECSAAIKNANQIVVFRSLTSKSVQEKLIDWARAHAGQLIYDCDDILIERFPRGSLRAQKRREYEESVKELIDHAALFVGATEEVVRQNAMARCRRIVIDTKPAVCHFETTSYHPSPGVFNIGYAGGAVHQTDFALVAPALEYLLELEDAVHFYWWGAHPGELSSHPKARRGGAWCSDYKTHLERIQRVPIDLWIVPLADSPHNAARSPIKAFEYVGMNAGCLFSNVEPYKSVLSPLAENLLVNNDTQSWIEAITSSMGDQSRLRRTGEVSSMREILRASVGRHEMLAELFPKFQRKQPAEQIYEDLAGVL